MEAHRVALDLRGEADQAQQPDAYLVEHPDEPGLRRAARGAFGPTAEHQLA
jgi:hypothetical protein